MRGKLSIKAIRVNANLTQQEMVDRMVDFITHINGYEDYHLTTVSYSRKESGIDEFTWAEIKAISKICNISVTYFM